ncbi:lamin tail domain-containing protein [Flavobacterium azooxidireducens]|uniref:Lamin tail domain-containing protein n=1 Tax=Flavobacterium azooxidireducens TaxID=1871076 RepID=A0ABY4KM58_9FLAO|nr:lamin tail domain-containing protein [Flavobacterium azooxidireducens]UPQ80768.1 lamin tail domain-containing protein [Flavobacterium azooxidireducens]
MMKTKITFKPFFLLLLFVVTMGWGQTFEQITSLESLTSGEYLIVGDGSASDGIMLNTTSSGPIINFTAVTNPGSTITTGFTNNNVFAISVESNQITIYNPSVGYVSWGNAGTGTANHAGFFNNTPTNNEKWTFSVASGLWTLSNVATPARQLQWNNSNPRFACYTSAQVKLKLYKKQVVVSEPTLSVAPITVSDLTYVVGEGPSEAESFVVSGTNLDGSEDVTLLADIGFEISTNNSTFSDEVVLSGYNGANTTIYVRLAAGLSVNSYNGIVYVSGYDLDEEVSVSGIVTEPAGPLNHLVISQVYGGGGNSGAPYKNDFVEIYNPTASAVSLNGWSIQYASSTGIAWTNNVDLPNKSVQPGGYFLVQLAGGATGSDLPTADHIGTINMSGTNGKVALVNSTTPLTGTCPADASIIDFVGFGSANCFEGSAATGVLSNSTAALRNNNGCDDTDVNSADFTVGTPTPRNSASASFFCDFVTSPILTATPTSVSGLTYVVGSGPSNSGTFELNGLNLDGSQEVVVLPGDNFEISLNNSTWFDFAEGGITLSNYDGSATTVYVRLVSELPVGNYTDIIYVEGYDFDLEINVAGEVQSLPDPELIVSQESLDFGNVIVEENSASQTFTLSGSFLTSNVLLVAPDDFVLSTNDVDFSSFLNLGQTGGSINGQPITVYVRFQPSFSGATGGDIEISSNGATTQIVSVSGTGVNPIIDAPVATAATTVSYRAFTANWEEVEGATSYQVDVYTEVSSLSPELVINGGYENGDTSGYSSATGSGNYFVTTTNPHSGNYAVARTGTDTSIIQQDVTVEVGKTYVFSFWYNNYSASGTNGLKNFSIQGTSGTNYIEGGTPAKLPAASTWTKYERTFTATQSTIRISLRSYEAVTIDDISIRSTDTILENVPVFGSPFTVAAPETSLNVSGLSTLTTYSYVVRAVDAVSTSENSNEISVTTLAPVLTQIRPYFCGTTLQFVNSSILADTPTGLPVGATVTGYRYEITNLSTTAVREVEKTIAMIRINETDMAGFNTAYSIRAMVRINNEWQDYGTACTILTPAIPTTAVSTVCGQVLPSLQSTIYATTVVSSTGYEFEVSRMEGGVAVETTTIERSVNNFKLTLLSGIQYVYASEYQVRVRVKANVNGIEGWSNYGAVCSVYTPEAPEAAIDGCGGEQGIAPAALNTPIYATPLTGATQYRFTLSDGVSYNQVYTTSARFFRLSTFNALQTLTPGGQYSVTVEAEIYGYFYAGKDCNILVPGGAAIRSNPIVKAEETIKDMSTEFKAVAYPNPFANSFAVDVRTSSTEKVSLTVYDMAGRLLEVNEVNASEVANYQFGDRYPSGVYNMIVTQGEETRTVRVVKQ